VAPRSFSAGMLEPAHLIDTRKGDPLDQQRWHRRVGMALAGSLLVPLVVVGAWASLSGRMWLVYLVVAGFWMVHAGYRYWMSQPRAAVGSLLPAAGFAALAFGAAMVSLIVGSPEAGHGHHLRPPRRSGAPAPKQPRRRGGQRPPIGEAADGGALSPQAYSTAERMEP
jgi:hypothetical protein